jgi:HlyD family secretion protein
MSSTETNPKIEAAKPKLPKKNRRTRKVVIFGILFLVAAGLGTFGFLRKREPIITVETAQAKYRNLTELVLANGKIQPVLQVVINPEVSGEIISLPVKEGQFVKKGELLVKIKPDNYIASTNSAFANYQSSLANKDQAQAEWIKAEAEFKRNQGLFEAKLVSESVYSDVQTAFEVAKLRYQASVHQGEMAKAALARAQDDLSKTVIYSPLDGTVTKLKSQAGERVVGTAMMAGTEIMTVANLDDMEARVDIGEMDIVLIALNQKAKLEVDAFHDRKFDGTVYEIANSAKSGAANVQQQDATKFEVKIRVHDKAAFRPGMSVTAEIETRSRTNVLSVPIQCVTSRLPKGSTDGKDAKGDKKDEKPLEPANQAKDRKKETAKPLEVVFVAGEGVVKMVPVTRGISDNDFVEITSGLKEGDSVISGSYKAINRELEDGKKIKVDNNKHGPKEEKK